MPYTRCETDGKEHRTWSRASGEFPLTFVGNTPGFSSCSKSDVRCLGSLGTPVLHTLVVRRRWRVRRFSRTSRALADNVMAPGNACKDSLAVSLFGMVALELATFQQATNLCMIYGMLLPCMVGLDVFWMATNKASKLVIAMGILSFIARVFSVPCWMSMWQQGFLFASGNFAPVLQPDGYSGPPSNKSYPGSSSQNPAQAPGKAPVVGGYQSIT